MRNLWKRRACRNAGKPLPHTHQANLVTQPTACQSHHQREADAPKGLHTLPQSGQSKESSLIPQSDILDDIQAVDIDQAEAVSIKQCDCSSPLRVFRE